MRPHLTILAVLHLLLSLFGLFTAAIILVSTVAAGAVIGMQSMPDVPGWTGALVGTIGTIVAVVFGILALPGLALAYGLQKRRPWARPLGLVLGAINLLHFPFGTIVGGYTLWAMLQQETKELLNERAAQYV
jgi:hypothetical protein